MTLRPFFFASALLLGCNGTSAPAPEPKQAGTGAAVPYGTPGEAPAAQAEVGKPGPDFTLQDYDGKAVHLADLRGKTVVLEWFNPDCPFVKASHTKGSLKGLAKRWTDKGVVWLAVDSSAPGKQGNPPERVAAGKKTFEMDHDILADETGRVGKLYGATNTPHLFVIDAKGVLVYRGAIDNSPDGEAESPTGGTLINYVDQALKALAAGKPIEAKDTKAYGCSIKYAH
jgi:peroxiredoxin